ncbi:MAG: hypothetical protein AVDCRST_MAG50-2592, partial [uncultured Acidimicrobiales bacterium]
APQGRPCDARRDAVPRRKGRARCLLRLL